MTESNEKTTDLIESKTPLLDHLLAEVPWASESDRAHYMAALITTAFCVRWPSHLPILHLSSNRPGLGISTLVDLMSLIWLGAPARPQIWKTERDIEWGLNRSQAELEPLLVFDATRRSGTLQSSNLCRVAHQQKRRSFIAIMTADHHRFNPVIGCMALPIRLATEEGGHRFHGEDPRILGQRHADHLHSEVSSLYFEWVAEGRPEPLDRPTQLACEDWSAAMAGILCVADIPGFLDTPSTD